MHAVQCGQLARERGCAPTLVAACFLHDIGHLLHDLGEDVAQRGVDARHEDHGELWLRPYFPPEVTEPVRLHVQSKRYMAAVDARYRAALSPASERSLMLQGGPMDAREIEAFKVGEHFEDAVLLRRFDDMGKDPSKPPIDPKHFRSVLEAVILPEDRRRAR
jgi:predicted HD phosphohydrolase